MPVTDTSARPHLALRLDNTALHRRLAEWNRQRLSPTLPTADWQADLTHDHEMRRIEGGFIEDVRSAIATAMGDIPSDPDGFVSWFEQLEHIGPGQNDPLFEWLESTASFDDMRWFLTQEIAGEAGFDDLVAMTQVKMPIPAKLELARNYWDEMGQGTKAGMHGPMLDRLAHAMHITPSIHTTVAPALALGNTLIAFATTRRYAYHAIGALGVVELTAPTRARHVSAGLKRLGLGKDRLYFALHATLDIKHSKSWNTEVLHTLVSNTPACAKAMAEGAWMRLLCGAACFEAYRAVLWKQLEAGRHDRSN